jgi:hypothetical protein
MPPNILRTMMMMHRMTQPQVGMMGRGGGMGAMRTGGYDGDLLGNPKSAPFPQSGATAESPARMKKFAGTK